MGSVIMAQYISEITRELLVILLALCGIGFSNSEDDRSGKNQERPVIAMKLQIDTQTHVFSASIATRPETAKFQKSPPMKAKLKFPNFSVSP